MLVFVILVVKLMKSTGGISIDLLVAFQIILIVIVDQRFLRYYPSDLYMNMMI